MKLADYLEKLGIKHGEFASRIGVSQAAVTRYARGARIPHPRVMAKIEGETKGMVTPNDFFASRAPADTEGATA